MTKARRIFNRRSTFVGRSDFRSDDRRVGCSRLGSQSLLTQVHNGTYCWLRGSLWLQCDFTISIVNYQ